MVANAAAQNFEYIGMPEGIYPIAHATLYLATAPKSNSVGAYFEVRDEIEKNGAKPVPIHLMDASRDGKGSVTGRAMTIPPTTTKVIGSNSNTCPMSSKTAVLSSVRSGYEAQIAERLKKMAGCR